ncbi:MAG: radical SAM protein [Proteobacteria bacterium]|nr:radical SAM protein [Pseudomonadota bacterium]
MKNSKLKKIGWGFGLCNMNCEHCYNGSSTGEFVPRYTLGQLIDVADKICPYIRDINFGTGEVMCNPNVVRLIQYITDTYPHIDIAVTSNGYTIVNMDLIDIKRRLSDVDISIDFPDKDRHNAFRRHPQAWEWAIRALEILVEVRMQRTIAVCVTSRTSNQDIMQMLRLANKYGTCLRFSWYRNAGRGVKELQVSAERAWQIIEFLSDKAVFGCLDSVFAGPLGVKSSPCPGARFSARIHQDMNVTAYPFLQGQQWSAGNILHPEVDLVKVYNSDAFVRIRNREVPFCENCEFAESCAGGCITRAILHSGGLNEIDDYCPIRYGQMRAVERSRDKIVMHKQGNLVHEGYLCTTILRPYPDV